MGKHARHLDRGDCLEPTAIVLLDKPLEVIHEDHLRARQICALIDEVARGSVPDNDTVSAIVCFVTRELPLHRKDEKEDLFPLLRRRCAPEDEIEKVIAKLLQDHRHAHEETPRIVVVLEDLAEQARAPTEDETELLLAHAAQSRRHLILENAIILPFARLRLTETDLDTLNIRMCQRRGLNSLKERSHAQ